MALKTVLDNLDDVDEMIRSHYIESKDPKTNTTQYILGIEGSIDPLPGVKALRNENGSYRIKLREAQEKYSKFNAFEGMNPEEIITKLDRIAELEATSGGKLDEKAIDAIVEGRIKTKLSPVERIRDTLASENQTLKQQIESFVSRDKQRAIADHVRTAATKLKMQPEAVEDAIMYAERIMDVDEDGVVTVKDKVGFTPGIDVSSWLGDMQSKRPHWWGPSSGGGAGGSRVPGAGGGDNPWSHATWNMTKQGEIFNTDPKRAESLALSAGTKIGGARPAAKRS